ncbi:RimK family alpha-L-glutamate ligase [Campylobacter upsaliensis]
MLIIATCKAYKEGNEALKKLKAKLENLHYQCELKAWQEIRVRHLAQNTLILPLAVWDYSLEYANFLHFLNELERAKISILNPSEILKMNADKSYLKILEEANLPIIDSIIFKQNEDFNFSQIPFQKAVIKPLVGQSGYKVRFLEQKIPTKEEFPHGALIQPFIESVEELGEFCLIFFGGKFNYAIHRQTQKDWRANSNYGVKIAPLKNPSKTHIDLALKALKALKSSNLLYARVDLLPQKNGKALINEVELIEPSLYFDFHENALEQFIKNLLHFHLKANC